MPKHNTPSLMKVDPLPPPVLGVSGSSRKELLHTFATAISHKFTEDPRLKKVKMPSVESLDGTTDSDDHLDVYKTHMYVQDFDDAM